MELDDFKSSWERVPAERETVTSKNRIMELIQHKSYGPVATLKAALLQQIVFIPVCYAIFLWQAIRHPELRTDPFFGLLIGIALLISAFFSVAYIILGKMNGHDSNVKDYLQLQLRSLRKIFLCYRATGFGGVILLAVFLEVFRHRGTALLMQDWYDLPVGIRLSSYVLLLVVIFFSTRTLFNRQFGQHVHNMQELVQQLD